MTAFRASLNTEHYGPFVEMLESLANRGGDRMDRDLRLLELIIVSTFLAQW